MLAIRLQRTGRKGHAQFRIIVQDSRRTPTSGNIVYQLGNYNPHSKNVSLDKEKAEFYLSNGARPSSRVVFLMKQEGVKLPSWVNLKPSDTKRETKNPEKLRRNRPAGSDTKSESVVLEDSDTKKADEGLKEANKIEESAEALIETPTDSVNGIAEEAAESKESAEEKIEDAAVPNDEEKSDK